MALKTIVFYIVGADDELQAVANLRKKLGLNGNSFARAAVNALAGETIFTVHRCGKHDIEGRVIEYLQQHPGKSIRVSYLAEVFGCTTNKVALIGRAHQPQVVREMNSQNGVSALMWVGEV